MDPIAFVILIYVGFLGFAAGLVLLNAGKRALIGGVVCMALSLASGALLLDSPSFLACRGSCPAPSV